VLTSLMSRPSKKVSEDATAQENTSRLWKYKKELSALRIAAVSRKLA